MAFLNITTTLGSAVTNGSTFNVAYPAGWSKGRFSLGFDHVMVVGQQVFTAPEFVSIAPAANATGITVTNRTGATLASGTTLTIQVDLGGDNSNQLVENRDRLLVVSDIFINLGSPATASANAIQTSAALTAAAGRTAPTGGALVANGVATMDVPRNVVAAWTNTAVLTVRGFDEFGNAMTESSASGVSFTGAKAFATVTSIQVSADVTGLTVGTGTVLGLPTFLPAAGLVTRELVDLAVPGSAGTFTAGLSPNTASTATTADVRGTYAPNAANLPNGDRGYALLVTQPSGAYKGNAQFAG